MKTKKLLLTTCLVLLTTGNVMADDTTATWEATTVSGLLTDEYFPMLNCTNLNLNVWGTNAFDDSTKTITYKTYYTDHYYSGMIGWEVYDKAKNGEWNRDKKVDFTTYSYLVVQLNNCPGFIQELQYKGTEKVTTNGVTSDVDTDYGMDLGSASSNHCSVSTTNYKKWWDETSYKMTDVMRVSLRDAADTDVDPSGNTADNCGQLKLSNVFLTNTLPDWDDTSHVTKTPDANFGTICLPYNATVAGAYIYQISSKSSDEKTINLTPYNGLLRAGVPYIYKSLTANTRVDFYQIKSGTEATASTNIGLGGIINKTKVVKDKNYYIIHNDKLYKVDSDVSITNGAYIDLSSISTITEAKGTSLNISEETTGINSVSTKNANNSSNTIYNLSGIRVSNNQQKGIYIKNGKKYIK